MRNTSGLFILFCVVMLSCNSYKEEVDLPGCTDPASLNYNPDATIDNGTCLLPEPKQVGFVLEYTASWCSPCGAQGSPKMHDIYDMGDVVAIACHVASGDPMHVPQLYNTFTSCRPTGGGVPSFWVGDVSNGGASHMSNLLAQTPPASVIAYYVKNGDKLEVKTLTRFFSNASGDYYLSVYVLESGIDGSNTAPQAYQQAGAANPDTYKHDFVLRTAATPDAAYGEKILSGDITAGKEVRKDYSITLDPTWTNDVYAAVVLWKLNTGSGMYEYVNGYEPGKHASIH